MLFLIALCFLGIANPETIQQNIENLKKRSAKKLVAQALYYGTEGESPLARDVSEDNGYKPPVHQRLGLKRQYRVPVLGTNTSSIGPKKRDFRKITTNRTFKQTGDVEFVAVVWCIVSNYLFRWFQKQQKSKGIESILCPKSDTEDS